MLTYLREINWISAFGIIITIAGFISGCRTIAQSDKPKSKKTSSQTRL